MFSTRRGPSAELTAEESCLVNTSPLIVSANWSSDFRKASFALSGLGLLPVVHQHGNCTIAGKTLEIHRQDVVWPGRTRGLEGLFQDFRQREIDGLDVVGVQTPVRTTQD